MTDEPHRLASATAKEIAGLSWEELDAFGERVEDVVSATGRSYRVKSIAFWDMEEWESGMYVIVTVKPTSGPGWRRWRRYRAVETRGGEDDPVPSRPT